MSERRTIIRLSVILDDLFSSIMTNPSATITNEPMSETKPPSKSSSYFSYLIQPTTPCILGTEIYEDEKSEQDDEFFLTAGGIIHSCPNIYELSIKNQYKDRQLQSCEHLLFMIQSTTSIKNHLNNYDIEFSRYSIQPRFQPINSLQSIDTISSEIELYHERHASGLSRRSPQSSLLPTVWKSEISSLSPSMVHQKRSYSVDHTIGQTI